MANVNRKLTSPKDPVKGGSKAKAAKATKAAKAPKTTKAPKAAKAPKATKAPKTTKAAGTKKDAADKKFDSERKKHLAGQRAKAKGASLEKRLKERLAKYSKGLTATKRSQGAVRKLMQRRQSIALSNLKAKQKAGYKNLVRKQNARLKARIARKPSIKSGKIVTPKVQPKAVALVKPKLKPLPRLKKGKETTAKQVHHKGTSAQKAGAKKAQKTKAKGVVKA